MAKNYVLKPEDQLILNCSLTNASEDNIKKINHLITLDLDWNYLIDLAYRHRLSTLLYWHLNEICPNELNAVYEKYEEIYQKKRERIVTRLKVIQNERENVKTEEESSKSTKSNK